MVFHQFLRPCVRGEQGAGGACFAITARGQAAPSFRGTGGLGRVRSRSSDAFSRGRGLLPGTFPPPTGKLPGSALLLPPWPGFLTSFGKPGHGFFHNHFLDPLIPRLLKLPAVPDCRDRESSSHHESNPDKPELRAQAKGVSRVVKSTLSPATPPQGEGIRMGLLLRVRQEKQGRPLFSIKRLQTFFAAFARFARNILAVSSCEPLKLPSIR